MKLGSPLPALAALMLVASAGLASAAPRTYMMDRNHSQVGFNIRHFFSRVHGRFDRFTGTIVFDPDSLAKSSCEVTIQDSSINTANERRDSDLRGENFFWVEKYPTISFKSTKVMAGKTKEHFQIQGDLTIRDVTKPVTLETDILGMGPVSIDGQDMGNRAGFSASTTINRKDYGIVWNKTLDAGGTMLGDDVEIVLNVEAVWRDQAPAAPKPGAQPMTAPKPTTTKK